MKEQLRQPAHSRASRLLAIIACVVISVSGVLAKAPERKEMTQAKAVAEKLVIEALAQGAVGLSVALAYDNDIVLERGFGLAEVEHDVNADEETMFRIASIIKQFTAALIMKYVEQGKIALDDPISKYIDFDTGDHVVTVRHLLTHTSGIKSHTGLGPKWERTLPLEVTHDEIFGLVEVLPFDFPPGIKHLYNDTSYYLLGVILEKLSDQTYDELLLKEVAAPLELTRTRYGSNGDIIKNRAQGYELDNGKLKNDELIDMSQPGAAGAILSTAGDLLRWQRSLTSGQVVSKASYAQMTTPYELADGSSTDYGFGLSIGDADGLKSVRHDGGINGFNSMLVHFPETGVGIAVISHSPYRAATLATNLSRAVHNIVFEISDLNAPEAEIKRLVGKYAFDALGFELTIKVKDDYLWFQVTGQPEDRLKRQGDGFYRASYDNAVALEFKTGSPSPGLVVHQGGEVFDGKRKADGN